MLVRDVMTSEVVTVTKGTPVLEVIATMLRYGVGGVPVIDRDRHVVGVISEADVVARVAHTDHAGSTLAVLERAFAASGNRWTRKAEGIIAGDVMTAPAALASTDEALRSVAARMVTSGIKRLPVVDLGGRLVGIVTQRDLLRLFGRSDAQIRRSLQAALSDPTECPDDHDVIVEVRDGLATLTGWVHTAADASFIESLVRGEPGVTEVHSEIVVRESAAATTG